MKPIAEVYPDCRTVSSLTDDRYFDYPTNYQPMLESLEGDIIAQADQADYSGDSLVLYSKGITFGFLSFGWGSCSGCDSLQACCSYTDIDKLRTRLKDGIQWKTLDEMLNFLRNHDWEGSFINANLAEDFKKQARTALVALKEKVT